MVLDVVVEILTVTLDELFLPVLPSKDTSRCEMMTNHNVNNHIRKSIPLQHPHIEEQKWIKCKHEVGWWGKWMRMISLVVLLLPETIVKRREEIYTMKGSGDDDNHRLGEMLLFLVLLSLVLFCCLARPTVETKQYIEMLCIECETKKNTRWNCYAFLVCWIYKCDQSIHIYDDTVYYNKKRSIYVLKNNNTRLFEILYLTLIDLYNKIIGL